MRFQQSVISTLGLTWCKLAKWWHSILQTKDMTIWNCASNSGPIFARKNLSSKKEKSSLPAKLNSSSHRLRTSSTSACSLTNLKMIKHNCSSLLTMKVGQSWRLVVTWCKKPLNYVPNRAGLTLSNSSIGKLSRHAGRTNTLRLLHFTACWTKIIRSRLSTQFKVCLAVSFNCCLCKCRIRECSFSSRIL